MASKTTTVSPEGARAAGCSATCDSYYSGVVPPSYQGEATLAYTNYQVVATGVGNWRPKLIKVTHSYTRSDGSTGGETITYLSSDHGDANPWSFPATKNYSYWDNPFEWTETDSGTESRPRTIDDTITGVEVEFEESTPPPPTSYTITTAVSPAGSGTATGGGTFNSGASCTLTATPASGYSFVRWEKNGAQVSTSSSYTFTVSESATYTAIFESATPLVHIRVEAFKGFYVTLNGISGTTSGAWTVSEGDFPLGDTITITASAPNPTLNPFKAWYLDPYAPGNPEQTGTLVPEAGATYTFTASANATYFATFFPGIHVYIDSVYEYGMSKLGVKTAIVAINGQTNNTDEFDLGVPDGSLVTLTATDYGGYENITELGSARWYFIGWSESGTDDAPIISTSLQYQFTAHRSEGLTRSLFARYGVYTQIKTEIKPGESTGSISTSPQGKDGEWYRVWTDTILMATPNTRYRFVKWTKWRKFYPSGVEFEEDISTNPQITIDVYDYDDWTIRAYFKWDGTDLLVNSANLGSPVQLVYDPTTNLLVADY